MTAYYGTPSEIEALPTPAAAVNIASSTNASPTVITTSSAHGLQTGQAIIINGHATNTNANGSWIATVVSPTTLKLSTFAGFPGTFVNGNGVGGATGTVQKLALPGVDLPQDFVNDIDAACWNVPLEGVMDMVMWLAYRQFAKLTILAGGTLSTAAGSGTTIAGTLAVTGTTLLNGATTINGATEATDDFEVSGTAYLSGLTRYRAPDRLNDADHTISTASADVVILAETTAGVTRTITVTESSAPVPQEGERLLIQGWKTQGATPSDLNYIIQRESGFEICKMYGTMTWVLIQFEGGVWRGIASSGRTGIPLASSNEGSVVPGAGW